MFSPAVETWETTTSQQPTPARALAKSAMIARAAAGAACVLLLGCDSSSVAPGSPRPAGTFVLDRSAPDSAFDAVAAPIPAGRSCVTFVSSLRFAAPDSVIETRRYVLPSFVPQTTLVDTGTATFIGAGSYQLAYSHRVDTAAAQVSNDAVARLSVIEHFGNNSYCLTTRIVLSYRLEGP
jgi:hypothetical protein